MSYEGHSQLICEKGHYWTEDCFRTDGALCPDCGSKAVWENMVDATNGCKPIDEERHCQCGHIDLTPRETVEHNVCPCCKRAEKIETLYDVPVNSAPHIFPPLYRLDA